MNLPASQRVIDVRPANGKSTSDFPSIDIDLTSCEAGARCREGAPCRIHRLRAFFVRMGWLAK